MNCKQCGAPVNIAEDKNYFHCEYCGSYAFPDPNQDQVALLDEVSVFACPLCKKPLVTASIKNIRIFSCPNCRGNLIEQSRMLPILRQTQHFEPTKENVEHSQNKSELTRTLACPSCQKTMSVYPYGGLGNILIQGCEHCRLIWLDFGELSKIIRSYWEMYNPSSNELGAKKKTISF